MPSADDLFNQIQPRSAQALFDAIPDQNSAAGNTGDWWGKTKQVAAGLVPGGYFLTEPGRKFVSDAAAAVGDYVVGAYQGGKEMMRTEQDARNMMDRDGNLLPGYTQEQLEAALGQQDKALTAFTAETLEPTAMIAGAAVMPKAAIPAMIGEQALEGYRSVEGTPLQKAGNAIRQATYGPLVDIANDPEVKERFEANPARMATNTTLAGLQVLYPVERAVAGAKGAKRWGDSKTTELNRELSEPWEPFQTHENVGTRDPGAQEVNVDFFNDGRNTMTADPRRGTRVNQQEEVPITFDEQGRPDSITLDGVQYVRKNPSGEFGNVFSDKTADQIFNEIPERTQNRKSVQSQVNLSDWLTGSTEGLETTFVDRLAKLAQDKGEPLGVTSGFRSIEEQQALWEASDKSGKWVAEPGKSRHNVGFAVDTDLVRNMSNEDLAPYGLYKPMDYEPWHVEPIETKGRSTAELGGTKLNESSPRRIEAEESAPMGEVIDLDQRRQEAWNAGDLNAVADTFPDSPLVANALRERAAGMDNEALIDNRSSEQGGRFSTGQETTIPYYKNLEKSPNMRKQGDPYAQGIEPKGEYIGHDSISDRRSNESYRPPNFEFGSVTFKNPLVLEYKSTGRGGWKTDLQEQYGGKTGAKLSQAVMKDGYDGIITVDSKTGEVQEIVNLRGVKSSNREYMADSVPQGSPAQDIPSGVQVPDTVTRRNIVDKINELFTKVSTGRLGKRGVLGWFDRNSDVIRTKDYAHFRAIMHEIGHYLDKGLNLRSETAFDNELISAVDRRFGKAYNKLTHEGKRGEGIAEFIHDYFTQPTRAQQEFPGYYHAFETRLAQEPQIKGKINTVKKMLNTWYNQAAQERVKGAISFGDDRTGVQKAIDVAKDPAGTAKAIVDKGRTAFEAGYDNLVDQLAPLDRMMRKIEEITGEKIPLAQDVFKQAWLTRGWAGKAQTLIEHGLPEKGVPALQKIIQSVEKDIKGFMSYVVARREMDAYNLELRTGVEYQHAMSKADAARTVVAGWKNPAWVKAQRELVTYQNHLLDLLVDAGIMSRTSVDAMKQKWPNYAPFFREFNESGIENLFGSRGFGNVSDPIKSFTGSTRDIINPMESIIKNTYHFINLAERNKVGRLFVDLAEKPGLGTIIEKVTGGASTKDSTFSVWNNGRKESYNTTPELYRAIMLLDKEAAAGLIKILAVPAGWLRAGAVLSPEFIVRNPVRDAWSAFIYSRYGFIPGIDTLKGLMHLLKKDDLYWEYMNSGAAHSAMVSLDRDYLSQSIQRVMSKTATEKAISVINPKTYLDILRAFSEATEMSTRLGAYENARTGYSGVLNRVFGNKRTPTGIEEAALGARDITLDFSRKGNTGLFGKHTNRYVAFWNATIQGVDKMVRSHIENPIGTATKSLMSITLPSIVLYYMNRDDPRYQELLQWQKDLFWIIPTKNTLIKIPKPFEAGILYGTSVERMLQWVDKKDPNAFKGFGKTIKDSLFPSWIPTAMLPVLEWTSNYSWFLDRDIVSQTQAKLPPKLQYGPNTSAIGKAVGNAFNVSPAKVDNSIRGYTGGLGGLAMTTSDLLAGEFEKRPAMRASEYPGIRAFTATPYKSSQSVQDFYDRLHNQEQLFNELKQTNVKPEGFDPSEYQRLKTVENLMTSVRQQEKAIMASTKMSSEEKRNRLDQLKLMAVNYARIGLMKQQIK